MVLTPGPKNEAKISGGGLDSRECFPVLKVMVSLVASYVSIRVSWNYHDELCRLIVYYYNRMARGHGTTIIWLAVPWRIETLN